MKLELIIAGFGGQGVLFAGNLIAQASMIANYNVTYLPVYGPEMRGGTCNCTVIISDKDIASPLVLKPSFLIVLNYPSFIKFIPKLKKGGYAIINSDMINPQHIENIKKFEKKYKFYFIPVSGLAESLNTPLLANLCAVGAFYQITKIFNKTQFKKALKEILSKGKSHLCEPNLKAFELGAQYIKKNYKI